MANRWTRSKLLDPASDWIANGTKDAIRLYHGCTSIDLDKIEKNGIDRSQCNVATDFGRGFYLTNIIRQARQWAWIRYYDLSPRKQKATRPVILRFELQRYEIGRLDSLAFVSGAYENDGYWSLVQHCRLSPPYPHHHRHEHPSRERWYDIVSGPVAAHWYQRMAAFDGDQISFHTARAVQILQDYIDNMQAAGNKDWIEEVVKI